MMYGPIKRGCRRTDLCIFKASAHGAYFLIPIPVPTNTHIFINTHRSPLWPSGTEEAEERGAAEEVGEERRLRGRRGGRWGGGGQGGSGREEAEERGAAEEVGEETDAGMCA